MNISLFYNSLISDWTHGNAHFLRVIISSFRKRNFNVKVYEPDSLQNLLKELTNEDITRNLIEHGLRTIKSEHTCEHRVVQSLEILKHPKNKNIKTLIYE